MNPFRINLLAILSFSFILFLDVAYAFTKSPYIPVTKPTPTATKTICASGCDYSTLEAADQDAQPGWLIKIKAGTYSPTSWNSSGTSGNEIVIEAFGNGNAIIDCNGSSQFGIRGSYIIIDGGQDKLLIFDGGGLETYKKPLRFYGGDHITISRVIVRNIGQDSGAFGGANIEIDGDYAKIYNSIITNSCSVGIYGVNGKYHEIRNNLIYNNEGSGIQYNPHEAGFSADEVTIAGNMIYDNGFTGPAGIRPGITITGVTYDTYIYNNMVWGNKKYGIQTGAGTPKVYNNTLYGNIDAGFRLHNGAVAKNNICYNNGSGNWIDGDYLGPNEGGSSNNITTNPTFASTNKNDDVFLKLRSTSTDAINQGYNLSSKGISDDFFGNPRPLESGYDIGAHEYCEGQDCIGPPPAANPAAPQNLHIVATK